MIGKLIRITHVSGDTQLDGETGVIESFFGFGAWVIRLDNDIPGYYSGTAFVYEDEFEVIQ